MTSERTNAYLRGMQTVVLFILLFWTTATRGQYRIRSEPAVGTSDVTISLTETKVTDKTLELRYRIKNDSAKEAWICEIVVAGPRSEPAPADGGRTVLISRCLNVPSRAYRPQLAMATYARLPQGHTRTESLLLPFPVYEPELRPPSAGLEVPEPASAVLLEIGYYLGDLPAMAQQKLKEAEEQDGNEADDGPLPLPPDFDAILWFNESREGLRNRSEEVVVSEDAPILKEEQVVRLKVDNMTVPVTDRIKGPVPEPPYTRDCTRFEIRYQPSMLQYFFPYADEQSLLSSVEIEYLQSQKEGVLSDPAIIKAFAYETGGDSAPTLPQRSLCKVLQR
jgi:hypothetical protein